MAEWHIVKQGEWLSKIAAQHNVSDWKTIWNHANNAKLKQARDPEILFPGDKLYIPDNTRSKNEGRGTGSKHTFQMNAPKPETLRVTVLDAAGKPLAQQKFTLKVGEQIFEGTSNGSGEIIVPGIKPTGEHEGELTFADINMVFPVAIGHLNPAKEKQNGDSLDYDNGISGLQMRLTNLGYNTGPADGVWGPQTRSAAQGFQVSVMKRAADEVTYELDSDTRKAIIEAYGC